MFLLIFSKTYLKFSYIPKNVTFSLREACHYTIDRPATEGGGGDGGEGGGGGEGEGARREMLEIPCTRWEFDTSPFTSTLTSEVSNTDRGFCNASTHASASHCHKSANNYSSRVGITDLQLRQHEWVTDILEGFGWHHQTLNSLVKGVWRMLLELSVYIFLDEWFVIVNSTYLLLLWNCNYLVLLISFYMFYTLRSMHEIHVS